MENNLDLEQNELTDDFLLHYIMEHFFKVADGDYCLYNTMEENGMEQFFYRLISLLLMIKYNFVNHSFAYAIYNDILDFESGEFDCLFSQSDLNCIKDDIKTIKQFFERNPSFLFPSSAFINVPWVTPALIAQDERRNKWYSDFEEENKALVDTMIYTDETEYGFCGVKFDNSYNDCYTPTYHYLTGNYDVKIGDMVKVPVGKNNKEQVAEVVSVSKHLRKNAPFPVNQAKTILEVISNEK